MKLVTQLLFQSTLPHGERLLFVYISLLIKGFNPRSHMGSDLANLIVLSNSLVSIHAPTWGATLGRLPEKQYGTVSIHAPTWGATYNFDYLNASSMFQSTLPHGERRFGSRRNPKFLSFNPRSHMGSDAKGRQYVELYDVSIHAPTWGATLPARLVSYDEEVSIHAPTWGATLTPFTSANAEKMFQSTLPHGERL